MSRAYIYMEHPETGHVSTLGRLTLERGYGEFLYDLICSVIMKTLHLRKIRQKFY